MEALISHHIVSSYFTKLISSLQSDVCIVGAGPSGLLCAGLLAQKGYRVSVYERKLAPGGGMWGGAMLFNQIIVQDEALPLLELASIQWERAAKGLVSADSVQATAALIHFCTTSGAKIFNAVSIEDVILDQDLRVGGLVINWAPVHREGMHVDPLMIASKVVLDATGHSMEVITVLTKKNGVKIATENGSIMGEGSLRAEEGERAVVEKTGMIYPGLYVSGMAANGVHGASRMGPIFGGMLLSGQRAADLIHKELQGKR